MMHLGSAQHSAEHSLIECLCDTVLRDFTINRELLDNWHAELSEVALEQPEFSEIVSEEVLLAPPPRSAAPYISKPDLVGFLERLRLPVGAETPVLNIILLELLVCAATVSFTVKIELFRNEIHAVFADSMLGFFETNASTTSQNDLFFLSQHARVLVAFSELGGDVVYLRKLLVPLVKAMDTSRLSPPAFFVRLVERLLANSVSNVPLLVFNDFEKQPISIPLAPGEIQYCFTIQFWFKLGRLASAKAEDTRQMVLFQLAPTSSEGAGHTVVVKLLVSSDSYQVVVDLFNNGNLSTMSFPFNQRFSHPAGELSHIAITYDAAQRLSLFIEGECSEYIPCPILQSSTGGWRKLYVGSGQNQYCSGLGELVLRNLAVLNMALTHEWVAFLHAVGSSYDWAHKELLLNNVLSLMNEIQGQRFVDFSTKMGDLESRNLRDSFTKRNQSEIGGVDRRVTHTRHLMPLVFRSENVVLDFYGSRLAELEVPYASKVIIHRPRALLSTFYGMGGTYFLLKMIEKTSQHAESAPDSTESGTFAALEMLLSVLNDSWRMAREFENISGYGILGVVLGNSVNQSNELKEKLVACVLQKCGYASSGSPLITNTQAYRQLLLNADHIFVGSRSLELFLHHLNSLVRESEYSRWNMDELQRLKLLRKLIHVLKTGINADGSSELSSGSISELTRAIKCIVAVDSSIESIRALSLFVVYLLVPGEPTTPATYQDFESYVDVSRTALQQIGLEILRLMTLVLCGTKQAKKTKRFSRAITLHWILLLLGCNSTSLTNQGVVQCALRLFSKLVGVLGQKLQRRFFHGSHGIEVLTYYLKEWWHDDGIMVLLFRLALAEGDEKNLEAEMVLSTNDTFALVVEKISTQSAESQADNVLVLPELLIVLNNIMLHSMNVLSRASGKLLSAPSSPKKNVVPVVDNMETSLNVLHLLSQMPAAVRSGVQKSPSLAQFFATTEYLEGVLELVAHLRLSLAWINEDLSDNFQACYTDWVQVLTEIFFSKINDSKQLLLMVNSLNDISRQIALDTIFPSIIGHMNQFVSGMEDGGSSSFVDGALAVLCYYYSLFIAQNYYVSRDTVDMFTQCLVSVVELEDKRKTGTQKVLLSRLKSYLGEVVVRRVLELGESVEKEERRRRENGTGETDGNEDTTRDESGREIEQTTRSNEVRMTEASEENHDGPQDHHKKPHSHPNDLDDIVATLKFLLYRQATIFQPEVLGTSQVAQLVTIVWGIYFKLPRAEQIQIREPTLSFMRTCYMLTMDRFGAVLEAATCRGQEERQLIVEEFFRGLLSQNDEGAMRSIHVLKVKRFFLAKFGNIVDPSKGNSQLRVEDMVAVMLQNGSLWGSGGGYVEGFARDCQRLQALVVHNETHKYNQAVQDREENRHFFVSAYGGCNTEYSRLFGGGLTNLASTVDYIENNDSMRRRVVLEEQLGESERLSYHARVPTKPVRVVDAAEGFEVVEGLGMQLGNMEVEGELLGADDGPTDQLDHLDHLELSDPSESSEMDSLDRRVLRSLYLGDRIAALWNVSQIHGLVPVESLMILGNTHVYLIENYVLCGDGSVVAAADAPPEVRDPYSSFVNSQAASARMDLRTHRSKSWGVESLSCVSKRQFLLRDVALEMYFADGASVLVTCLTTKDRDAVYARLLSLATGTGLDSELTRALSSNTGGGFLGSRWSFAPVLEATKKWRAGELSNFYYLMLINTVAGRTYNDLTQYPVFPWVLADYTSEELDLLDPKSFRDLAKPMGAQTETRAQQFRERYEALASLEDPQAPAFHYGTHYSLAMVVTSFLIRLRPHVQSYLLLQGGKFDHADRLFYSVEKAWNSAARDNTTDVRELTPEFFYLSEFLANLNNFELGALQNGDRVDDVVLPPWAKGDPKIFIHKHRQALESPHVSANLHRWIDLVFGVSQSGPAAIRSLNVFHHLSYNGAINPDRISDETEKRAVIGAINNFGQTPLRVFSKPHPPRDVLNLPSLYWTVSFADNPPKLLFESKLGQAIAKLEWSTKGPKGSRWVGRPACVSAEDELLVRRVQPTALACGLMVNLTAFLGLHDARIAAVVQMGHKQLLTGGSDGVINVWKHHSAHRLRFVAVLRGHDAEISDIKYNRSHRVGVSTDTRGTALCWDLVRNKFMRRLPVNNVVRVALSEESGLTAAVCTTESGSSLAIFTLNGDRVLVSPLEQPVTALAFASANGTVVPTDRRPVHNSHVHWDNEILAVAFELDTTRHIRIVELVPQDTWVLREMNAVDISATGIGTVTSIELLKKTETDHDDKLCRGTLQLVMGDSTGRVYVW